MLKKIVTPEDCAKCRLCCIFTSDELIETPVVNPELRVKISDGYPDVRFISKGTEHLFRMEETEPDLFTCPMLTDHGCKLAHDEKPFDCEMWPFCLMELDGLAIITIDPLCKPAFEKPLSDIMEELKNDNLADRIFREGEMHPEMFRPYRKDCVILAAKRK